MEIKIIDGVKTYFITSYEDYTQFLKDIEKEPSTLEDKNIKLVFDKDVKFRSFLEENHFIAVFNGYVQNQINKWGLNIQVEVMLKNDINASTVNRAELISEVIGKFIYSALSENNVKVDCVFENQNGEKTYIDGSFFQSIKMVCLLTA